MSFRKIDLKTWDRLHYYNYFMDVIRCRFGMTANIEITDMLNEMKSRGLRCYPTFTYLISRVINQNDEFKMAIDNDGNIGVWDSFNVRYPMFNEDSKTVTSIWLEYEKDFNEFYKKAILDIEKYKGIPNVLAKGPLPPNFYDITSIPWVSFTAFDLDVYGGDGKWLVPFVVIGKFFKQDNKVFLPVHITVHHAICDGYHVGKFFEQLQDLVNDYKNWM